MQQPNDYNLDNQVDLFTEHAGLPESQREVHNTDPNMPRNKMDEEYKLK